MNDSSSRFVIGATTLRSARGENPRRGRGLTAFIYARHFVATCHHFVFTAIPRARHEPLLAPFGEKLGKLSTRAPFQASLTRE